MKPITLHRPDRYALWDAIRTVANANTTTRLFEYRQAGTKEEPFLELTQRKSSVILGVIRFKWEGRKVTIWYDTK